MSDPKRLKCIKCGCDLGIIYKATLYKKILYMCKDCYQGGRDAERVEVDPQGDDSLNRLKSMFGFT